MKANTKKMRERSDLSWHDVCQIRT